MPVFWIERPDGVKYFAVVSFSAPSSPPFRGITDCTEPLPKVVRPTSSARWRSCKAPETISAAEAVPELVSTTMGRPCARSPGLAL